MLVFFVELDLSVCTFVDADMLRQCCGHRSELADETLIRCIWDERMWASMQEGKQQEEEHDAQLQKGSRCPPAWRQHPVPTACCGDSDSVVGVLHPEAIRI